jgi:hypothetical protein
MTSKREAEQKILAFGRESRHSMQPRLAGGQSQIRKLPMSRFASTCAGTIFVRASRKRALPVSRLLCYKPSR